MPIYVESLIRSQIDELWEKTQRPDLHRCWDLRFSEIEYLPRADERAVQRFLYTTRIGLGIEIAGEGESAGEHHAATGARTSALKFWSSDPKSLIEEGSGFWKYTPTEDGVQFVTVYDYRTRFGLAGLCFDRAIFRPLMAWATAWSFDRLRLWIERKIDPAVSRQRMVLHATTRWTLAFIWIYQGLVPKLLFPNHGEAGILVGAGLSPAVAHTVQVALGCGEIAFGVLHLVPWRSRAALLLDVPLLLALLTTGALAQRSIVVTPFNAVTLTAAMIALVSSALITSRDLPSSGNTRWSSREPRK